MSESLAAFQSELLTKIECKSSSKISMDAFLFKAFKFFDLYNNGWVAKSDFFKTIAKCGVVVDTHDMDYVFKQYSGDDHKIYYKQFIENLLFKEQNQPVASSKMGQSSFIDNQPQPLAKSHISEQKAVHFRSDEKETLKQSKIQLLNNCETYSEICDFIIKNIRVNGVSCLLDLAVKFKMSDSQKTHRITKHKLHNFLPYLTSQNITTIFNQLSDGNSQQIDYSILVYDLKGQSQEASIQLIESAFQLLDVKKQGQIAITYMLSRYFCKYQFQNFQNCVNLYCKFQGIDDGVYTDEDFSDFFGFLAFSFASFQHFKNYIHRSFYEEDNRSSSSHRSNRSRQFNKSAIHDRSQKEKSDVLVGGGDFRKNKEHQAQRITKEEGSQGSNYEQLNNQEEQQHLQKKSVSRYSQLQVKQPIPYLKQVESIILRIKKRLATKGTKGFLLFQKALKHADINKDNCLSFDEFKQVIKEQRIDITNTQCGNVFDVFDEQGTGYINFPQFMYTIRGKMPENRIILTEKLWQQVQITEQATNFGSIKHILNFRNHPDIQNGRKFEQDLWKQIQQTILTIQELNGSPRSDKITKQEFLQYLQNFSLSIIDDKLFESVLYNFWRLNAFSNIHDKYAGSRKIFDPTKKGYLVDHHRYVVHGGSVSQNAPFGTSVQPTTYFTEHGKL